MVKVEVRTRIVGSANADARPPTFTIELPDEMLTVRDLITRAVEEQIHHLLFKQNLKAENVRQMLDRQYLTEAEVQREAQDGAVKLPSSKPQPPAINVKAEVKLALRGFEQKTYVIVVDGEQPALLTETITLHPTSKVTFLRLTPLVGG